MLWDAPDANTASVAYSTTTGELTIPAAVNGYYIEIHAAVGGNGATGRVQLDLILQKDTGAGFADAFHVMDYVTRDSSQDEGGVAMVYIDPTPVATGDKYRFNVRRNGGPLNRDPLQTRLSIKFISL